MRLGSVVVLAAALCRGADLTVCSSGCAYTDFQLALNAAQPGDTITLAAGQTFSTASGFRLPVKRGSQFIRIRSSRLAELPEGHRVGKQQADAGLLPKLYSTTNVNLIVSDPLPVGVSSLNTATDVFTATNHKLSNGTRVSFSAYRRSPYVCPEVGVPFSDCTAARLNRLVDRSGNHGMSNGMSVYLFAEIMPAPLQEDRPYYLVNATAADFQLSEWPGGAPIDITGTARGMTIEATPHPLRQGRDYYITSATANTFQLAETAGGPPIDITASGHSLSVMRAEAIHHYIFEGIEFANAPGTATFATVEIGNPSPHRHDQIARHIHIDRCYIHGNPGENRPVRCLSLQAKDSSLTNSTIAECKDISADAQAVWVNASSGNLKLENNRMEGSGETIMFGGAYPGIRLLTPSDVRFRRNYMTKPLEWNRGVRPMQISTTELQMMPWGNPSVGCNTAVTASPGGRCFMYTREGVRYEFAEDMRAKLTAGFSGSGSVYVYFSGGLMRLRHNLGAGSMTCTGGLVCEAVGTMSWPPDAVRLYSFTVTSGSFTANYRQTYVLKNAFEIKHGKGMLIEGNVLEHQWADAQSTLFVFNVQAASNHTESLNFWARSSDLTLRRNVLRRANSAVGISGGTWVSGRPESWGLGGGGRIYVQNNLFDDINSYLWAPSDTGILYGKVFTFGVALHVSVSHNSMFNLGKYLTYFNQTNPASDFVDFRSNIIAPRPGSGQFPHTGGDGTGYWTTVVGSHNRNGVMANNAMVNLNGNASYTTPGVHYPASTYLLSTTSSIANLNLRDYAGGDYRLIPGSTFTAGCTADCLGSSDGKDLGADMDEVEALTNGVVEGLPEWSRRSNVRVHAGPASAVLSYTAPSAAACEVRVYDSPVYARPIEDVDPAAGRHLDSRPGTFRRGAERDFTIGSNAALASSTQYWYKLSCGGETAVGSFRTTAAAPAISVRLGPAPAGAVSGAVEYGPTVDLGSSTGASVCSSGCTIAVPAGQRFYRWVYLDGSGRRIFVSDPVMVPGA